MQQPLTLPTARPGERTAQGLGAPVERSVVTSSEHGQMLVVSTLRTVPGGGGWYRVRTWHVLGELPAN